MLEKLFKAGCDPSKANENDVLRILWQPVLNGDTAIVKKLLDAGCNLGSKLSSLNNVAQWSYNLEMIFLLQGRNKKDDDAGSTSSQEENAGVVNGLNAKCNPSATDSASLDGSSSGLPGYALDLVDFAIDYALRFFSTPAQKSNGDNKEEKRHSQLFMS
ncbi:hypothetical protein RVIR1_14150 [Candidatus Rickettsiella viridis]|uniref:Ankyrin repeat protein n=1 Tax=Candidatus Rickettsiella viridis TaxID=676208 RepID=A0A2Z5UXM6_9COXI|nr:hypothetical protein [Candidatus Rickettsiella viridis]BBB15860.1 hypothetical protein RVIR1_14150 [Candidatus Rickettsiella viridis]